MEFLSKRYEFNLPCHSSLRQCWERRKYANETFHCRSLLLAVSRPNNDAFITSTAQQTKKAFLWHTTRCDIRQYNDIHYVYNTYTMFIASQQCASCISAFHQLEPRLNFSIKHAFFESHWQLGPELAGKNVKQTQCARASLHNREGNVETARAVECRYGSVCLGLGIGHKNKHGHP